MHSSNINLMILSFESFGLFLFLHMNSSHWTFEAEVDVRDDFSFLAELHNKNKAQHLQDTSCCQHSLMSINNLTHVFCNDVSLLIS